MHTSPHLDNYTTHCKKIYVIFIHIWYILCIFFLKFHMHTHFIPIEKLTISFLFSSEIIILFHHYFQWDLELRLPELQFKLANIAVKFFRRMLVFFYFIFLLFGFFLFVCFVVFFSPFLFRLFLIDLWLFYLFLFCLVIVYIWCLVNCTFLRN